MYRTEKNGVPNPAYQYTMYGLGNFRIFGAIRIHFKWQHLLSQGYHCLNEFTHTDKNTITKDDFAVSPCFFSFRSFVSPYFFLVKVFCLTLFFLGLLSHPVGTLVLTVVVVSGAVTLSATTGLFSRPLLLLLLVVVRGSSAPLTILPLTLTIGLDKG